MENPEFMRTMMRMNPQTQRLMEERPDLARMMEDPEVLRQSARMVSNPSLMREMMRNQDTAMGRLDATPGGHAALERAHREIVDPLHNAMHSGGESGTQMNQYAQDAQGIRNTAPLANPWGAPQTAPNPTPSATQATAQSDPAGAQVPPEGATPMNPRNPFAAMQNPMMQQMMQNPQMMQQMMQNPQM